MTLSSATTAFPRRPARITDIRLPRMTPPSATTSCRWRHANTSWNHGYKGSTENGRAGSHLVPMILQWPPKKKGPKVEEVKNFGSIHTLRSPPDQGETYAKFGSDRFRNMNLYKFYTNKQTDRHSSLYIRFHLNYRPHVRTSNCSLSGGGLYKQLSVFHRASCKESSRCHDTNGTSV
jgi:hypothetical protein